MIPHYTTENYRQALLSLLPTGPIWSKVEGGILWYWANIIGESYKRNSVDALNLLTVAFPATATDLLPEWENTLGLPDPCLGYVEDINKRQKMVVGRLTDPIGNSANYYIQYAKNQFDQDITITQYAPFRFGTRFGHPFGNEKWSHTWKITSHNKNQDYLGCVFNRLSPAHTIFLFGYDVKS